MKIMHIDEFIDLGRNQILNTLDNLMKELNCGKMLGTKDCDLPELFKAIDAHMKTLATRVNDDASVDLKIELYHNVVNLKE